MMTLLSVPVLKTGYSVRPCTMADVEAVVDLMNACAIAAAGQPDETVDQTRADWLRPDFDQSASQRIVETAEGRVVGWAEVHDAEVIVVFCDVYVHPDFQHEGIGEYLIAWVESRARQQIVQAPPEARVVLRGYALPADQDVWYSALLRGSGMQLIRHFWHMELNLDTQPPAPVWPDGITLKIGDANMDKRPVFTVRRTAFQDQFGHVDRPFEDEYAEWLHRIADIFVPELWFMAMDGDQLVAVCLCKLSHNGEEDRGWVSSLGVLREYRRRGIGEALLQTAFNAFYTMGKQRVGLGVDASSLTGAATLYKRVGMHVARQFDLYEKELRVGVDLTTHG